MQNRKIITALWMHKSTYNGRLYWKGNAAIDIFIPEGARLYVVPTGEKEGKTHILMIACCTRCGEIIGKVTRAHTKDRMKSICQACLSALPEKDE